MTAHEKRGRHVIVKVERLTDDIYDSNHYYVSNKQKEVLGNLHFDADWKCFTWQDQPEDMRMSKSCLDEAFKLATELRKELTQ